MPHTVWKHFVIYVEGKDPGRHKVDCIHIFYEVKFEEALRALHAL